MGKTATADKHAPWGAQIKVSRGSPVTIVGEGPMPLPAVVFQSLALSSRVAQRQGEVDRVECCTKAKGKRSGEPDTITCGLG